MIRLGVLFPQHLNLNGDLGNAEVVAKQLEWRGIATEIVPVETDADLSTPLDFILVGHGSTAAWAAIETLLRTMAPSLKKLIKSGTPGLAISTGFEKLLEHGALGYLDFRKLPERISKFHVQRDGESEVLGYLNTDVDLPVMHREGNWISTLLHGPVLAKNPNLLEEVLSKIANGAGFALPIIQAGEKAGQLADLIDEVWKLERDLASE
jgi:lipid II isoglutaminyl synthase (glutamine-hydrolysing)